MDDLPPRPHSTPRAPATKADPAELLAWYDRAARRLPWRAPPGAPPMDPYRVWLSEIMLQQTTVAAVGPYFRDFTGRWPTVEALAAAEDGEVMAAWAGLGYYARARNLLKCARAVAASGGRFPDTEEGLRALPGIGPYTAAAVAAIAFGRRAVVLDGNVERVMARLHAVETPLPAAKEELRALAGSLTPEDRPGDHAQAVMDLGATICTPRRPACGICPWRDPCAARALGIAEELPRKVPKKPKPERLGVAFVGLREDGAVLLERRPEKGLLGGMLGLPGTEWREAPPSAAETAAAAPCPGDWRPLGARGAPRLHPFPIDAHGHAGRTSHVRRSCGRRLPRGRPRRADDLPTVMRKALLLALD